MRETIIKAQKDKIFAKHGCQSVAFSIDEAEKLINDLNASIEDARNYVPEFHDVYIQHLKAFGDLTTDFSRSTTRQLKGKKKNRYGKKTSQSNHSALKNIRAMVNLIQNKHLLTELSDSIAKIENLMKSYKDIYNSAMEELSQLDQKRVDAIKQFIEDKDRILRFADESGFEISKDNIEEMNITESSEINEINRAIRILALIIDYMNEDDSEEDIPFDIPDDLQEILNKYEDLSSLDQLI